MGRVKRSKKFAIRKAEHMNEVRRAKKAAAATQSQSIFENDEDIQKNNCEYMLNQEQDTTSININYIQKDLANLQMLFNELPKPLEDDAHDLLPENTIDENSNHAIQIAILPEMATETPKFSLEGRRLVDIGHFFSKLQEVSKHGTMECGLGSVEVVGEKKTGLHSLFRLECNMCKEQFYVPSDIPGDQMTVNHCAVAGTVAIGCGQSQLQELSAALNLPIMSAKTYKACHCKLATHWEKVSAETMSQAAAKERDLAIAEGRLDKNGTPMIDVIADGCWCKRTYKKNYSALSGAAAIIEKKTGEVLFLGVKNKYCSICDHAEKNNQNPKTHKCFKNYNGPSTAMESEILVEGFKNSIDMYNLIYARMVSDGDSNTYSKLLKSRPYPHMTIEKIECRNHMLRNLCNKLVALQTDTKFIPRFRKLVTTKRILSIRKTIRKIIRERKSDSESERRCNIEPLYNDILLAHLHAFGDHTKCKSYFCDSIGTGASNVMEDFCTSTLWARICFIMSNLAEHAPSLIHDIDSNTVERYNSIVAKLVGGKRINFSKSGSYQARCHAAVVSFNCHKALSSVYKSIAGRSPRGSIKKLEDRRIKYMNQSRRFLRKKNRLLFTKGADNHYGDQCEKPDMTAEIFDKEKETFLRNLIKTKQEIKMIERETVLQSSCSDWLELRRSLLTGSNFGRVIKIRDTVSCSNLVKDILYKDSISHVRSVKHGKDNEKRALEQLEKQENIKISPCGLFIDENIQYLGATPDGLIAGETIVEIKCPVSAYKKTFKEAVESKKITFYKINKNGDMIINKKHIWYYQIQGQLHVTKRLKCLFAIWTGEDNPLWIDTISKDDSFWTHQMQEKLCRFYKECLLPELVDPRFPRKQQIRDPDYVVQAIAENARKKETSSKKLVIKRKLSKKNVTRNQSADNGDKDCDNITKEDAKKRIKYT